MIALNEFLQGIEANVARTKVYKQPGDGSNGECDCIGLIIGGKRLAGGKWNGIHGTNYAARYEMGTLKTIESEKDLFLGEVVYKVRAPEEELYALPEKYKNGGKNYTGDVLDYYHVGIVTHVNPIEITHCTTIGPIRRDSKLGKWKYGGMLEGIDYGEYAPAGAEVKKMVVLSGGNIKSPINMRKGKSISSERIAEIPQDSEVELLEAGSEWSRVTYHAKTGYVMTKFVHTEESNPDGTPILPEEITVSRAELERAYDILGDLLGLRG